MSAKKLDVYKLEDIKQHTSDKTCWLAIHGKVYDVTEFLEEHPGGYDIILTSTGKDATQDFDEIGHSNSAKSLLDKYLIGTYESEAPPPAPKATTPVSASKPAPSTATRMVNVLLPVALLAVAVALNYYLTTKNKHQ